MKVTIKEIEIYTVKVEADNEDEATDKAWEMLDTKDKFDYHNNSDGETEVYELD